MRIKALLIFFGLFTFLVVWPLTTWSAEVDEQRLLAETLPKDKVVWLELGGDSSGASKSLAVYRRAIEKNSKGTVIILKSSIGDTSSHAILLDDLAEHLMESYWHTLLVYVPAIPDGSGQKRLAAAMAFVQSVESKNEDVKKDGKRNLVLLVADKTATLLTPFITSKVANFAFTKVILLDAANRQGDVVQPFMELVDPAVAILDVSWSSGNEARLIRQQIAVQRNFKHYQPLDVPAPSSSVSSENHWIVKRIKGWLKKP